MKDDWRCYVLDGSWRERIWGKEGWGSYGYLDVILVLCCGFRVREV